MKQRATITENRCEKFVLLFESLVKHLTCGRTRMARILSDGVDRVTAELDIGRHLKKMRFYQATCNALTTFSQKRLLEHQVRTSFLLQPLRPGTDGKSKQNS